MAGHSPSAAFSTASPGRADVTAISTSTMRDSFGTSFIFSTHDPKIMGEAELTFTLEDGRLVREGGAA